jgi:hypothetical protein
MERWYQHKTQGGKWKISLKLRLTSVAASDMPKAIYRL